MRACSLCGAVAVVFPAHGVHTRTQAPGQAPVERWYCSLDCLETHKSALEDTAREAALCQ